MEETRKSIIDVNAIPEYKRDNLARVTLNCVRAFLAKPGGREFLEAQKVKYAADIARIEKRNT